MEPGISKQYPQPIIGIIAAKSNIHQSRKHQASTDSTIRTASSSTNFKFFHCCPASVVSAILCSAIQLPATVCCPDSEISFFGNFQISAKCRGTNTCLYRTTYSRNLWKHSSTDHFDRKSKTSHTILAIVQCPAASGSFSKRIQDCVQPTNSSSASKFHSPTACDHSAVASKANLIIYLSSNNIGSSCHNLTDFTSIQYCYDLQQKLQ